MLGYWNTQSSPFRNALNNAPKYVASTTLTESRSWLNSTRLRADIPLRSPSSKTPAAPCTSWVVAR